MKKLYEELKQLNEAQINRPGYKIIKRSCKGCRYFDEGDKYEGGLDTCTVYDQSYKKVLFQKEFVDANGICNLFKAYW